LQIVGSRFAFDWSNLFAAEEPTQTVSELLFGGRDGFQRAKKKKYEVVLPMIANP